MLSLGPVSQFPGDLDTLHSSGDWLRGTKDAVPLESSPTPTLRGVVWGLGDRSVEGNLPLVCSIHMDEMRVRKLLTFGGNSLCVSALFI